MDDPTDKLLKYVERMRIILKEQGTIELKKEITTNGRECITVNSENNYDETKLQAAQRNDGKKERLQTAVPSSQGRNQERGKKKEAQATPYVSHVHTEKKSKEKTICTYKGKKKVRNTSAKK